MILAQLKKICKQIVIDSTVDFDAITAECRILEDLCFNSMSLLMLAIGIEEEFSIRFPTSEAINCITVQDIINLIEKETNHARKK